MSTKIKEFDMKNLFDLPSGDRVEPFLRWVGSKRRMIKALVNFMPPKSEIKDYYEPFLGSGAFFLANGLKHAYLSDYNERLINTFRWIKEDPEGVFEALQEFPKDHNPARYYEERTKFNLLSFDSLDQAARFIYLNKSCFNGIYRENRKGEFNVPIGDTAPSYPTLENLKAVSKRLEWVDISPGSFREIHPQPSKGDFIYFDPPYHPHKDSSMFRQYTREVFSLKDQMDLAAIAQEFSDRGCFVMLSNSDAPPIPDLFPSEKGWFQYVTKLKHTVKSKGSYAEVHELIITNYAVPGME